MEKIKKQYQYEVSGRWKYPRLRSWYLKKFSTKQEKSFYFLHKIEYCEFPLKLRAARGKSLADPWDDHYCFASKLGQSWKHKSRRKSQYYRKKRKCSHWKQSRLSKRYVTQKAH